MFFLTAISSRVNRASNAENLTRAFFPVWARMASQVHTISTGLRCAPVVNVNRLAYHSIAWFYCYVQSTRRGYSTLNIYTINRGKLAIIISKHRTPFTIFAYCIIIWQLFHCEVQFMVIFLWHCEQTVCQMFQHDAVTTLTYNTKSLSDGGSFMQTLKGNIRADMFHVRCAHLCSASDARTSPT